MTTIKQSVQQQRRAETLELSADVLVIGGAMANTFLLAQGHAIGKSLAEKDQVETAQRIMAKAETGGATVLACDFAQRKEIRL